MTVRYTYLAKALRAGAIDGKPRKKLSFQEREACRLAALVLDNRLALYVIGYELKRERDAHNLSKGSTP